MTNRQLSDHVEILRKQLTEQLSLLEAIHNELQMVIEENHNLTMENLHLKERLDVLAQTVLSQEASELSMTKHSKRSQSLINLENIYDQGFHVCNLYYGKRRDNDENCMFCTEILFGEKHS